MKRAGWGHHSRLEKQGVMAIITEKKQVFIVDRKVSNREE